VGCCLQDSFKAALNIRVYVPLSLDSKILVKAHAVAPYINIFYYSSKKLCFRLSDKFDFYITSNLFRAFDLASKICETFHSLYLNIG